MDRRSTTPRQRARATALAELKQAARTQLAERGAAALSVRSVARDVGMSSAGVYRYFASRDDLLTALIVDAYDALGDKVERAESAVARDDLTARWCAVAVAVRAWAREFPQLYGLVFGSPVPGYAAPTDTIGPAARVPLVLAGILRDAWERGSTPDYGDGGEGLVDPALFAAATPLEGLPEQLVAAGLAAWAELFGLVSFELFGHFVGSVGDRDAFFSAAVERAGAKLGLGEVPDKSSRPVMR